MEPLDRCIRRNGLFLRRRDLLARGYSDEAIRRALGRKQVFRVRHGWYSVPDAPAGAVQAVRVGGRLTGVSALESYGLRVPRRAQLYVAVPGNACRLRRPDDKRTLLGAHSGVRVLWVDRARSECVPPPLAAQPRGAGPGASAPPAASAPAVNADRQHSAWRVSIDDALLVVLTHEPRDIAVACASAVMRHKKWSARRLGDLFRRAPRRVWGWLPLVCALDDSHGETFVRLWLGDAGYRWVSQPFVPGVGFLDGRVAPHVYIEVDGAQHDPAWTGDGPSSYERDHDRDIAMAVRGDRTIRVTYRQLYRHWTDCLAGIARAVADDAELVARRSRHPAPRRAFDSFRVSPKRRRSAADGRVTGTSPPN